MKKTLSVLLLACLLLSLALAGCGSAAPSSTAPEPPASTPAPASAAPESAPEEHQPVTMLVAAAASLETSFKTDLIPLFQDKYPWITVDGTYDSSGKLQTQIEEGLEPDVFMSAAPKQMNALIEGGFIDKTTVVDLVENEIVLIAPVDTKLDIKSFEDIVKAETIALGDPESVPVGQYAKEALTSLGVYDAVAAKTSFGTNVTEVLNWVAEGSADVGIVYATDAAQMPDKVKIIATAPEGSLEKKVVYPVGVLEKAPNKEAADLFVEFLQSPEAMAILEAAGFKSNL